MAGDWLQGPYVYALYQHYGYSTGDIGKPFIGFGSSMIFGTVVGSMADKYGRKNAALTYVVTYIASCITKHWSDYGVLMLAASSEASRRRSSSPHLSPGSSPSTSSAATRRSGSIRPSPRPSSWATAWCPSSAA